MVAVLVVATIPAGAVAADRAEPVPTTPAQSSTGVTDARMGAGSAPIAWRSTANAPNGSGNDSVAGRPPDIPTCQYYPIAELLSIDREEFSVAAFFAADRELGTLFPNLTAYNSTDTPNATSPARLKAIKAALRQRCKYASTPSNATVALTETDAHMVVPPKTIVDVWNEGVYADAIPATGRNRSVIPAGTPTKDRGWIRDAHATLVWLRPSTVFHRSGNTTITYVGEAFDLYAVSDYRIAVPQGTLLNVTVHNDTGGTGNVSDGNASDGNERAVTPANGSVSVIEGNTTNATAVRRRYELVGHTRRTCLLDGNYAGLSPAAIPPRPEQSSEEAFVAFCSARGRVLNHTASKFIVPVSTSNLSTDAITLATFVRSQGANVTERCEAYNTTTGTCTGEWTTTNRTAVNDSVVLTAVRDPVRRAPEPQIRVRAARFPGTNETDPEDDTYSVHVQVESGPVTAVWFGDGEETQRVAGQYRFFSTVTRGWRGGLWINATNGSTTGPRTYRPASPFPPVQVHAYPTETGPQTVRTTGYLERVVTRSAVRSPPSLPTNVHLPVVGSSYHPPKELWLTDLDRYEPGSVQLYGILPGQMAAQGLVNGEWITTTRVQQVTTPNVTVRPVAKNDTHVTLAIRLTVRSRPISTADRPGNLTVGDDQVVETNDYGAAQITVERDTWATVAYNPAPWHRLEPSRTPYLEAGDTYSPQPGLVALQTMALRLLSLVVGLLVPVVLVLWFAHEAVDADTWPPWTVFRW